MDKQLIIYNPNIYIYQDHAIIPELNINIDTRIPDNIRSRFNHVYIFDSNADIRSEIIKKFHVN